MPLTKDYIDRCVEACEKLRGTMPAEFHDSALLSYTHRNRLMAWLFWKRVDTALSLLGDPAGKSVLDFGCGSGIIFPYIVERGARVTGCDNKCAGLAAEVSRSLGIRAALYDDLFSIRDAKFDAILALDVLEHIEDLRPFIDRFSSLANEKARIILSGPTESFFYRIGRRLAGFTGEGHVRSIYDIESEFRKRGFKLLALRRLYPPVPLFRVSSWTK